MTDYTIVHITVGSEEMPYDKLGATVNKNTKEIAELLLNKGFEDSQIL